MVVGMKQPISIEKEEGEIWLEIGGVIGGDVISVKGTELTPRRTLAHLQNWTGYRRVSNRKSDTSPIPMQEDIIIWKTDLVGQRKILNFILAFCGQYFFWRFFFGDEIGYWSRSYKNLRVQ